MGSNTFQLFGLLAIVGAILYAIGDVLLLAGNASLDEFPKLKPYAKLLSDVEKMVVLSPTRLMWGALIGVFSTPLVILGFWQVYQGLREGDPGVALATFGLFGIASVIGTFVHGSFFYLGEYVQALNKVDDHSQAIIADMIGRHRKVMIVTYALLLLFVIVASILFSILVASGKTLFPVWMAAINPVTMTITWMLGKRVLPKFIRDWTEGAGFNIAYFIFFLCTTITLWNK